MDNKKNIKTVVVAGLLFSAAAMLTACVYGSRKGAEDDYPAEAVTDEELAALELEEESGLQ